MNSQERHARRGLRPKGLGAAATLLFAALACGEDPVEPPPPPEPVATAVEVAPAAASLTALGETVQLQATVRDQNGNEMTGASVAWSSGDGGVATVSSAGLVTATGVGEAAITATSGAASGTASITVSQDPAAVAVTPESATLSALGDTVRFSAEVQDANGNAIASATVDWTSDNDGAATVDADGLVTATGVGEAAITATHAGLSASGTVTVMQDASTVTLDPEAVALTAFDEERRISLTATDANGNEIPAPTANWASADEAVATVSSDGVVKAVADGETTVTATVGGASATVAVLVAILPGPAAGPPAPTHSADSVISFFSDSYDDVNVDTWSAEWDAANLTDIEIAGNSVKLYTGLVFAGIEFISETVNASNMTHFRMDIWTPDATEAAEFGIKLVDFGANGKFDGTGVGDDTEHEIRLTATEGLASGEWVSFDLPLASFSGLASREHLAQLIISGNPNTVYVDNVYLREGMAAPPVPTPTEAAPTPSHPADKVISLFSGAYEDVTVDTWSAPWDAATLEDLDVAGDAVKKYTGLGFAGIEFKSQPIDITQMTHFRMDVWTPDPTEPAAAFNVKLVDFGADGSHDGGDDTEHEVAVTAGLASEEWVSLDLPLADFAGLTGREHLAQLIISGDLGTVYVDNVYFREGESAPPAMPTEPAPTPEHPGEDVISLFSDAYDDVTVDTWSTDWDQVVLEDTDIEGDNVKKYTGLDFAGIEFKSQPIDITRMTHFRMDIWTPDPTADPAAFQVKLVDFGADGKFDGGDDTEHEVTLKAEQGLATGEWVALDLDLADFSALSGREHLAQLIISGDPNTVYVDNVYFRRDATPPAVPETPAPAPTHSADDVISLFSDAYDDVTVDTWSTDWDNADLEDGAIDGNAMKKYTNLVFAGIEFMSPTVDADEMTHFRIDIWTPDPTADSAAFNVKLVDFGANGKFDGQGVGDDTEHEIALTAESEPPLATGQWISFDIPLTAFEGLTARANLAQLILSGDLNTVYVDNVYLHR